MDLTGIIDIKDLHSHLNRGSDWVVDEESGAVKSRISPAAAKLIQTSLSFFGPELHLELRIDRFVVEMLERNGITFEKGGAVLAPQVAARTSLAELPTHLSRGLWDADPESGAVKSRISPDAASLIHASLSGYGPELHLELRIDRLVVELLEENGITFENGRAVLLPRPAPGSRAPASPQPVGAQ